MAAGRLRAGPGVGERETVRLDWAAPRGASAPADPEFAAATCAFRLPDEVSDRR